MTQEREGERMRTPFSGPKAISDLGRALADPGVLKKRLREIINQKGGELFVPQAHGTCILSSIPQEHELYQRVYESVMQCKDMPLTEEEARFLLEAVSDIPDWDL